MEQSVQVQVLSTAFSVVCSAMCQGCDAMICHGVSQLFLCAVDGGTIVGHG